MSRTGAQILVDQLLIHGARLGFGVPGESYLSVLDALSAVQDRFRLITCRQEGGAAFAASAYGKLTGRPGLCFVTRGPGATNAAIGVHTAQQDSTPMILFVGQVARGDMEREAFQEIDYRRMYGSIAKWAAQIDQAARIPEFLTRAFHVATTGRPGPVVLALPEDMLTDRAVTPDARPLAPASPSPAAADMERFAQLLTRAERPLVVIGGPGWDARARAAIGPLLAAWDLPAVSSFRSKDKLDNTHANYAGDMGIGINPALAKRIAAADLIVALGARLGEMATDGYTRLSPPVPAQTLVHIHPGAEELNRVYQAALAFPIGPAAFLDAWAALPPPRAPRWSGWREEARADYARYVQPVEAPGAVNLSEVMKTLQAQLPADAIVTNGAGNYAGWVHRFYEFRAGGRQLAPVSGAMGYGLPAAIAAAVAEPQRRVVALAGDGCFLMNGQELATAVMHRLRIVVLVFNNGMYGTIRMHQEKHYPGRVYGTDLVNPDFAAYARSFGALGLKVDATGAFGPALEQALAHDGPALIEIAYDPEAITSQTTLSAIRAAALKS